VSEETARRRRKVRAGRVLKSSMNRTIVVRVERTLQHPLYGKTIKRRSKLYADDPENRAGVGDRVLVMETRPLSKLKRWRLLEVLEKAPVA
jgi:small subunit ribosomal protein S17